MPLGVQNLGVCPWGWGWGFGIYPVSSSPFLSICPDHFYFALQPGVDAEISGRKDQDATILKRGEWHRSVLQRVVVSVFCNKLFKNC